MSRFNASAFEECESMEKSTETARANSEPPDLSQPIEVLKYLLDIETKRLDIAVRIEGKRDIVFPETSVIIHDIKKLSVEIEKRNNNEELDKPDVDEFDIPDIL